MPDWERRSDAWWFGVTIVVVALSGMLVGIFLALLYGWVM